MLRGNCPSLIISGPPGIGKTYTVIKVVENYINYIAPLMDEELTHDICSGTMTPVNLYQRLYENRSPGSILILDDIDSVFDNERSLNLLKSALDLTPGKTIGYFSESPSLRRQGIPKEFMFYGSVIFLTNIDFKNEAKTLKPHLDALLSRSQYIDIGLKSPKEKLDWVIGVIDDTDILTDVDDFTKETIIGFITENYETLNEVSLRMVKKIANLSLMGEGWQEVANITCF